MKLHAFNKLAQGDFVTLKTDDAMNGVQGIIHQVFHGNGRTLVIRPFSKEWTGEIKVHSHGNVGGCYNRNEVDIIVHPRSLTGKELKLLTALKEATAQLDRVTTYFLTPAKNRDGAFITDYLRSELGGPAFSVRCKKLIKEVEEAPRV